jgi:hypothetical protein
MSVVESDMVARPGRARAKPRTWQGFVRSLRRLGGSEAYSPVLCISTLLIVGLIVKTAPAIQALLAHN